MSYQVSFSRRKPLYREKYAEEDQAEYDKALGGACLHKRELRQNSNCVRRRNAGGASPLGREGMEGPVAYDHSVVPGKNSKLIETSDKVPSSGDVARYKDAKSQDGERVHRIALWAMARAFRAEAEEIR